MAALLAAAVAAGFAPTFFARDVSHLGPLPLPALVHGVSGTAWVLSFAAQTALAAARRVAWHRRFGWVAAGLGVAFVASGVAVMVSLEQGHGAEPLAWRAPHVFTNLAPLVAFATFVAAGVKRRARAAQHKRLMLLAAVVLLPPAIGRLFAALELAQLNLVAYASFAFANAAYDALVYRRPHAVSLLGAVVLVAIDVATTAWLAAVGS
jgi:hypothetical protein